MTQWQRVVAAILAVALGFGVLLEYRRVLVPTSRDVVVHPIYTVGDRGMLRELATGKRVVKFGPMFFGLYPGGFAFRAPEDARDYLNARRLDTNKWRVYELAGEFDKDSYLHGARNHISKTLVVVREHRAEP